jgi:hypothetical protein
MSMSKEEIAIRKVEINTFAALIHLTGSVEKASELTAQAKEHLYPTKQAPQITAGILKNSNSF